MLNIWIGIVSIFIGFTGSGIYWFCKKIDKAIIKIKKEQNESSYDAWFDHNEIRKTFRRYLCNNISESFDGYIAFLESDIVKDYLKNNNYIYDSTEMFERETTTECSPDSDLNTINVSDEISNKITKTIYALQTKVILYIYFIHAFHRSNERYAKSLNDPKNLAATFNKKDAEHIWKQYNKFLEVVEPLDPIITRKTMAYEELDRRYYNKTIFKYLLETCSNSKLY
jgi:hypothetical protein